jgi:translation initiation factor IF-2
VELPPTRQVPQNAEPRKPASARGLRRAERREATGDLPKAELQFKDARPEGPITITEHMTVRDFAEKLGVKAKDLIKMLFSQGVMAAINHMIDTDLATKVATDLDVEFLLVSAEEEVQIQHETEQDDVERQTRPPVVTVMGHVDHGKTTLLDAIRKAKVAEGEAGGITQHIGAYQVETEDGRKLAFLDTPGHEAFTMMRARGARATDIVVLVVAADDGVMPQTIEAIDHARAAEVPIVIAINKIDKDNANPDRVKKDLADQGLLVEDWGGDAVSIHLSALKGEGIDELLEMILLNAELLELKAAPELPAKGIVLEARKEIGRGMIATILVQDGTLQTGDVFVAGSSWGRVRMMISDSGERLKSAGPSTPVEVTGFTDLPAAGDIFQIFTDENKARTLANQRRVETRQRELAPRTAKISLEQLFEQIGKDEVKELPVIVKADVQGSVEVLRDSLKKASTEKVKVKVIHASAGAISTNDVILASASNAIIIGFNVRPERKASAMAEREEVEIRLHTVIYELLDELKLAMAGLLEPTLKEVQKGIAEVRETFKVPKIGVVAGCFVTEGTIPRSAQVRLLRDNVVIWGGRLSSLRRFKDDATEVRTGFECGIGLESFQDFKPGDQIEAFIHEEVPATL